MNIPIETDRLVLRNFREDDWQAVHAYTSDPDVVGWFGEQPYSVEQTRDWIQADLEHQKNPDRWNILLAVTLKSDDTVVGNCGHIVRSPREIRAAYAGYKISQEYWNNGYATEALGAMLKFGFGDLDLQRISMISDPRNVGSWRVMEKCGLRREGHAIQDRLMNGEMIDTYYYAMLSGEWQKRNM
jgi:ribosomal-protein-alanine N-acetyltransferase